jgi:hypothetical protein
MYTYWCARDKSANECSNGLALTRRGRTPALLFLNPLVAAVGWSAVLGLDALRMRRLPAQR